MFIILLYWLEKVPIIILFFLFVIIIEKGILSLKCYECTHQVAYEAKKQIFNKILASPAQCAEINFCQGNNGVF